MKTNKFHGQRNPGPTRAIHALQTAEAGRLTQPAFGDVQGAPHSPAPFPAAGETGRHAGPEVPLCAGRPLCATAGRWRCRTAQADAAPQRCAPRAPAAEGARQQRGGGGRLPRPALRSGHFLAIKIVSIALSFRIIFSFLSPHRVCITFLFFPPLFIYLFIYFQHERISSLQSPRNSREFPHGDEYG